VLERKRNIDLVLLDEQHQEFQRLIEEFDADIAAGVGESVLSNLLQSLMEYTTIHFGDEEDLMLLHCFPSLAAHRAEHNALAVKIAIAQEEYKSGKKDVLIPLAHYLHSWLAGHIRKCDRQYNEFINGKNLL
jgi:hemerythrin-like metal-binding protein